MKKKAPRHLGAGLVSGWTLFENAYVNPSPSGCAVVVVVVIVVVAMNAKSIIVFATLPGFG